MADLCIISESSEIDLAKRDVEERLAGACRQLGANMLRVMRGAGQSAALLRQMQEVVTISREYHDLFGNWPASQTIDRALRVSTPDEEVEVRRLSGRYTQEDIDRWEEDGTFDTDRAIYRVCRGALQKCASQLLEQRTQERTAEHELLEGVRELGCARERQRTTLVPKRPSPKPARKK